MDSSASNSEYNAGSSAPSQMKKSSRFAKEAFTMFDLVSKQRVYLGRYTGYSVVVDAPEGIRDLFTCGYFGKGTLSRAEPKAVQIADQEKRKTAQAQKQRKLNSEYEAAIRAAQQMEAMEAQLAAGEVELPFTVEIPQAQSLVEGEDMFGDNSEEVQKGEEEHEEATEERRPAKRVKTEEGEASSSFEQSKPIVENENEEQDEKSRKRKVSGIKKLWNAFSGMVSKVKSVFSNSKKDKHAESKLAEQEEVSVASSQQQSSEPIAPPVLPVAQELSAPSSAALEQRQPRNASRKRRPQSSSQADAPHSEEKMEEAPKQESLSSSSSSDIKSSQSQQQSQQSAEARELREAQVQLRRERAKSDFDLKLSYEVLQLSLEEAFFLQSALGVLQVMHYASGAPMSDVELWTEFSSAKKTFVQTYTVYHYLRSKGWVPRSGLKFGSEFIIYRLGPTFFHAEYSVVVRRPEDDNQAEHFNWTHVQTMSRMSGQVKKGLLICYVMRKDDSQEVDVTEPSCIRKFQVQETTITRFVAEKERD